MEDLCGVGKAAGFDNGEEGFEGGEVHGYL
jgi:hypothetical protein